MSDDLANSWGCALCCPKSKRHTHHGDNDLTTFTRLVKTTLKGEYELKKVVSCGSDANCYALMCASDGDTSRCLLGAGSYVAGDGGPLQHMSTSAFEVLGSGLCLVTPPTQVSDFTREHTIALPYYIPTVPLFQSDGLVEWENKCFTELHSRCLQAKMGGTPFKVLFLELILAGSGAQLHMRALQRLAALAELHSFRVVVDEIMTGGRTGTVLFVQQTPPQFQKVVTHVTMGKWLGLGIVLVKASLVAEKEERLNAQNSLRGPSTTIACDDAIVALTEITKSLSETAHRWEHVLKSLKVSEEDAWGAGILIFAPVSRTDHCRGLKNRFLPLIHKHTPVDKVPIRRDKQWTSQFFHDAIMTSLRPWANMVVQRNPADAMVCNWLIASNYKADALFNTNEINLCLYGRKGKIHTLTNVLQRAQSAGILSKVVMTKKRLRFWSVKALAVLPAALPQHRRGLTRKTNAKYKH